MTDTLKIVLEQAPNLVVALLALAYLARQNQRVLDAMNMQNERQFELITKLCRGCIGDAPLSVTRGTPALTT